MRLGQSHRALNFCFEQDLFGKPLHTFPDHALRNDMSETFTSVSQEEAGFRERARLSFELDADICVIGAGLAGLSIALEAARLGASVAVLEGRYVGWNASGNQLGTVMPGFGLPLADLIARVGLEDARELWALSKQGAEYVRTQASDDLIPGLGLSEGA